MPGAVDKSYGINVAKLAGLPSTVIKRADELLLGYESKDDSKNVKIKQFERDFSEVQDELREYIKTINPYEVTPIEAINILAEIKNKS